MDKCRCGNIKRVRDEQCYDCMLLEDIKLAAPNLTEKETEAILNVVYKHSNMAWDMGANEAVSDMAERM